MDSILDFKLQKTRDFSIFKKLEGNRDVLEKRIKKIEASVDEIGQIPTPIIVNEKMQIIDGQGRYELYKRRSLPIYYIVVPGLEKNACIAMNRVSTPWDTYDYINSYANKGIKSYQIVKRLLERYGSGAYKLSIQVIVCAASGVFGGGSKLCKSGDLVISPKAERFADEALAYAKGFIPNIPKKEGYNKTYLLMALVFSFRSESTDNEAMKNAFSRAGIMAEIEEGNYSNVERAMKSISDIYNKGRRANDRIHLDHEYTTYKESGETWIK